MPLLERLLKLLGIVLLNVVVTLVLCEATISLLLHYPSWLQAHPNLLNNVRRIYMGSIRSIIQFRPESGRYDPELFYTLRPGKFRFRNFEFNDAFEVNSLGTRDAEENLSAPELVVLGDSFAMGWGVAYGETFARRLAELSGLKTLNAGISSYGTTRELKLLNRIDTSRLKVLVIAYSSDDHAENHAFRENGNRLIVQGDAAYLNQVHDHIEKTRYYFGKYTETAWNELRDALKNSRSSPSASNAGALASTDQASVPGSSKPSTAVLAEADTLLHVLEHAPHAKLNGVRIVLVEISSYGRNRPEFIEAIRHEQARNKRPSHLRSLLPVDLSASLTRDDYYVLDDHINSNGHKKVAEALWQALR